MVAWLGNLAGELCISDIYYIQVIVCSQPNAILLVCYVIM